jgi:polar amino acid transport system substrate-binding protein
MAALLVPVLFCSSAIAAEKISVACNPTWPPMELLDDNKQIVGFDVDMIHAICKEVGLEAEFRNVAWDGIFAGVAAGSYDLVASGVTITPERQKAFLFTEPYYNVSQIIVMQNGQSAASFADLKGKKVGGQIGTTGVFVAQKCGVEFTLREYDDVGLAMQDLVNGRIDAVVCDSPVALYYANKKEGFSDVLTVAFRTEANEHLGFVAKKDRKDLIEKLNKGLAAIRANGTEAELKKKWLGD